MSHPEYFTKLGGDWSIKQYFASNKSLLQQPTGFEILCSSWVSGLEHIINTSVEWTSSQRKSAKRLLKRYQNQGVDWRAAREYRQQFRQVSESTPTIPNPATSSSSIVFYDAKFNSPSTFCPNSINTPSTSVGARHDGSISHVSSDYPPSAISQAPPSPSPTPDATSPVPVAPPAPLAPPAPPAPSASLAPRAPPSSQTKKRKRAPLPRRSSSTSPKFIKRFEEAFRAMGNEEKWLLPSGICVEDTLYNHSKNLSQESAVHSWIINTQDDHIKGCFSIADWKIICDSIPSLPDPDAKLVRCLEPFMDLKTPKDLQDHLDNSLPFRPGELSTISLDERKGRRWLNSMMHCWSELLHDPTVFVRNHNENWYTCRFWTPALDMCISTIDGSYVSRGETKSLCNSNRMNTSPPVSGKRRRVGHLYDGLLTINSVEVGVIEHGREFIGENGRKWSSDTLKVLKLLHDMLYQLQSQMKSLATLREMQVVGIIAAEWRYQFLRMAYAHGHVCILWVDDIRSVPNNISETQSLFQLLIDLWRYRELLNHRFHTVLNSSALTSQERMDQLLKPATRQPKIIPRTIETDMDGDSSDAEVPGMGIATQLPRDGEDTGAN